MSDDERVALGQVAGADSGLRCPECAYNLTGVVEERCPECGAAFDRAALLADGGRVGTPWERGPSVRSWLATCWLAVFRPVKLALIVRRNPRPLSFHSFAMINHGIAVVWWVSACLIGGADSLVLFAFLPAVLVLTGLEMLVGATLAEAPRFVNYSMWIAIARYGSAHLLVTVGILTCGAAAAALTYLPAVTLATFLTALVALLNWWLAFARQAERLKPRGSWWADAVLTAIVTALLVVGGGGVLGQIYLMLWDAFR